MYDVYLHVSEGRQVKAHNNLYRYLTEDSSELYYITYITLSPDIIFLTAPNFYDYYNKNTVDIKDRMILVDPSELEFVGTVNGLVTV